MKNKQLTELIRPDLRAMKPYSSARDEFEGNATVFLDANENPFEHAVNRYPDPLQKKLKQRISEIKQLPAENLFLGNGSDECIDLLYRLFCVAGKDKAATIAPSYGMYGVSAKINGVELKEVLLNDDFSLDTEKVLNESENAKLLFICSPNNPTGQSFPKEQLCELAEKFEGILVIDEAYIDFSDDESMTSELANYPNLVVCQTFSKAYGMAGIRLGMMWASPEIIGWINKIKPPYNINQLTQEFALNKLQSIARIQEEIALIKLERGRLVERLSDFDAVTRIFHSDANFILIRVKDAAKLYQYFINRGIVVRNRSNQPLCENCLRLTVGTPEENKQLIEAFEQY